MKRIAKLAAALLILTGSLVTQATSTKYGDECGGLTLQTSGQATPRLGTTVTIETHGHKPIEPGGNLVATLFMAGLYSISHSMGGTNNCMLLQSVDYMPPLVFGRLLVHGDESSQKLPIYIPLSAALVGSHVYWQAANIFPNANPGAITFCSMATSNGVDWRIDI